MTQKKRNPIVNLGLFLVTVTTVFFAGYLHLSGDNPAERIENGFAFAASLMAVLVAHEAGHYLMARKHRVDASLPYFIPIPPVVSLFGTMGAVIVMRGRIRSRNALMDVGAAGPLAGMIVAIPLLFIGLARCPVIETGSAGYMEGQSLLYLLAKHVVIGPLPDNHDILINKSAMAFAGWFGMLITMLNMFPIGQLDGGHIFYALFGDLHSRVSIMFHRLLFLFGAAVSGYYGWDAYHRGLPTEQIVEASVPGFSWIFLGTIMLLVFKKRGFQHPPTDDMHLSTRGKVMGIICLVLFVITFMPTVMRPIL
ncbi:MAG: site-2 protease family protein [Deltaproteobacteria bacterium]|nr:site-2 protease family protein [Deltaproteobacteria bacterium]MBN2673495.1 site-2 protease family protein [Deltaproteobacteria bacterium]